MAKKKLRSKKSQKQVETAPPPDSTPTAPTEGHTPADSEVPSKAKQSATEATPEVQPTVEASSTETASGEQPVPSFPMVEMTQETAQEIGTETTDVSTSTLLQHPASLGDTPTELTQVLATELASAPMENDDAIESEAVPTEATESQTTTLLHQDPQDSSNRLNPPTTANTSEVTKNETAAQEELRLEEKRAHPAEETGSISSFEELLESAETLEVPTGDTETQTASTNIESTGVDSDVPTHRGPVGASDLEVPMEAATGDVQIDPNQETETQATVASGLPEAPILEEAAPASVEDSEVFSAPSNEADWPLTTELSTESNEVEQRQEDENTEEEANITAESRGLAEVEEDGCSQETEQFDQERSQPTLDDEATKAAASADTNTRQEDEGNQRSRLEQEVETEEEDLQDELRNDELRRDKQAESERRILEMEQIEQEGLEEDARQAVETAEHARQEAEDKENEHLKEFERPEQSRVEQELIERERSEQEMLERLARQSAKAARRARIEAEEAAEEALLEPETESHRAVPAPKRERAVSFGNVSDIPAAGAPVPELARALTPPGADETARLHRLSASSRSGRLPRSHRSIVREIPKLRTHETDRIHAPKPHAVAQLIEDNRPAAPSPPMGRTRPRHAPTFDSDDDSDSALVQSRHPYGGEGHRDVSRGSTFGPPHQPRSAFASRVPVEPTYSNPPPPPPGYHPYYAPQAPPHYQNHGYGMSQPGYPSPNPYGPSSHSSSSPYQESWNQYPPRYPPYGSPPLRQDSSGSRDYPIHAIENGQAIEDSSGDVFSRIAQSIPDLHVLLARYKETHSQLSVREDLLRRASTEHQEQLRAKDDEIGDLKGHIRNLENRHSTDTNRLHSQISNLEEQVKEFREQIAEVRKSRKDAEESKSALETAMTSWETRYKELEDVHRTLQRTSVEEKARAWRDFDEWKAATNTRHDAEKIALTIQFDGKLKKAKDELLSERDDLQTKLEATQKDHDETLKRERESREAWLAERETLLKADHDSLQKGWEEQRDLLETHHRTILEEADKAWMERHADASRKAEEAWARADELAREKEELLKQYNQLRAESQKEKELIKSVASNLESEKFRLEKMMECYGDIAEIKGKGDNYYLVSFAQLQKQIIDLATTHFVHLPVRPPPEDLAQVPSNLPSFLGDTVSSRQVRTAYIAHTISKLITYRVFGPFLFSLGRRYDKADSLFSSMSHHIREKSTRKEAIWRQQTLLAAFTSSGAKQRINTAAGTVVEEIVSAIKNFADPKEEEGIKVAVKRIVKIAAETWRFARLEREMITATMPAIKDEEHQFTSSEYWPAYKPEATTIASLVGTSHPADTQAQLLLRIFPVIYRDSKHENFHNNGESRDEGCVFHYGLALYDDAEPVVARMEELKSAGLPSFTTAATSPTDEGKFPPPACPPPRDSPPSPPAPPAPRSLAKTNAADNASTRARPTSPTEEPAKTSENKRAPIPPANKSGRVSLAASLFNEPTPPKPESAFTRITQGSIAYTSPRNLIGLPMPVDHPSASRKNLKPPAVDRSSKPTIAVPLAHPPIPAGPPPPPPPPQETLRYQPSTESAILPPTFSRTTTQETVQEPDTPSDSRAVSPLFDAIDEIESLMLQRHQTGSTTHSRRRSTHSRRSGDQAIEDDLPEVTPRPESARRPSGHASSNRMSKTADSDRTERSEKSERTARTDKTDRDAKIRFLYENRPAALRGLWSSSPSVKSEKNEKSEKKKERSSKDSNRDSMRESKESKRKSADMKRRQSISQSISDAGTWDTNSVMTYQAPATLVSTNLPYPDPPSPTKTHSTRGSKRDSRELRRERSIPDNGTWDTNSVFTEAMTATHVSKNRPYLPARSISSMASTEEGSVASSRESTQGSRELRRVRSGGTWDTSSEITEANPATTISTNVPYSNFNKKSMAGSIAPSYAPSFAGTWDTNSEITEANPRTTVSTNVPYPSYNTKSMAGSVAPSFAGTWDTASEITEANPRTTVSTNVPYPSYNTRSMAGSVAPSFAAPSMIGSVAPSFAGTWDTASVFTEAHPRTTISTNIPYPTMRRMRSISDAGTWDTASVITEAAPASIISKSAPYQPAVRRMRSISDSGTWDTASVITEAAPPTTVSRNVPYPGVRRMRSISDAGTWDTNSVITEANPATTVSRNVPYPSGLRKMKSISDAGTWDTASVITEAPAPTTVSRNAPYPSGLRKMKSISDAGTWDTASVITEAPAPTTVSRNAPYPPPMRRMRSISDAGTWDTNSVITEANPATTVSTNVAYAAERRQR